MRVHPSTQLFFLFPLLFTFCSLKKREASLPSLPTFVSPPGIGDASDYRYRVFYELWVRTFADSDGDGIGDLKGLKQHIPELKNLGIGGVWLMPIYPSPLKDSGYDVSDYTAIHPDYGNLADFAEVVSTFHAYGILVYLDMVFNHTSVFHPWFQSLLKEGRESPYFDFYVLSPHPLTSCSSLPVASFGGRRWSLIPELSLYYFHQFQPAQPDLNFWNPRVREELLKIIAFWLDLGVDGFRFDVADRYYEEGSRCSLHPLTLEFFSDLNQAISQDTGSKRRGFVAEIWGLPSEVRKALTPERFPMVFHFPLYFTIHSLLLGEGSAEPLHELLELSLTGLPEGVDWAVLSGNHDLPRLATLLNGDSQKLRLFFGILLTLPGVPFLWMGDELGLPNGIEVKIDGRDLSRAPYPWDPEPPGYGFTQGSAPYLSFVPEAHRYAYRVELEDPTSLLNFVRRLIFLRNGHTALHRGEYIPLEVRGGLIAFERRSDDESIKVFINFSSEPALYEKERFTGLDLLSEEQVSSPLWIEPLSFRILKVLSKD